MSDLIRLQAYHAGEHTPRVKRENRTPEGYYYEPDDVTPDHVGTIEFHMAALLDRIRDLEARLEALESWKRQHEREQEGGK